MLHRYANRKCEFHLEIDCLGNDFCSQNFVINPKSDSLATTKIEKTEQIPIPHCNYLKFISSLQHVVLSPFPLLYDYKTARH